MENEHNQYIGNIINGLTKEAAYWKSKCAVLEAEIQRLKQPSEEYIYKEHADSNPS